MSLVSTFSTNQQRVGRSRSLGFTLIELMVVVAIVGILAAIALGSYEFATIKARRGAAKSCLLQTAQSAERFYTTNLKYNGTPGAPAPADVCDTDATDFYTVDFTTKTANAYTLRAAPKTTQRDTLCGTLTVTHTGQRTPTTAGCW